MKNLFDANAISVTIERALASAGLDTSSGPMHHVTETIRRALGAGHAPHAAPPDHDVVVEVPAEAVNTAAAKSAAARVSPEPVIEVIPRTVLPGTFERHEFSNAAGTLSYKLYVPALPTMAATAPDARPPMVVMLHGCTQSADDFAAGTRMNRLADEHGFLVLYPEQSSKANASKCWNWFRPQDQMRGAGEPSMIAGIVHEVADRHGVDPHRIFVAGLSAGAAMAVVLGETYPELFAGVGAHSGLAYGSAHDIPSAMAAMKGGRSGLAGLKKAHEADVPHLHAAQAVPIIVFHGDRDHTVHQSNGVHIVEQIEAAHRAQAGVSTLHSTEHLGTTPGGRQYSRTVHVDATGQPCIEYWSLHGAGHAWSGGDSSGSFTDGKGPDASAEMVRFFLALPRAGEA